MLPRGLEGTGGRRDRGDGVETRRSMEAVAPRAWMLSFHRRHQPRSSGVVGHPLARADESGRARVVGRFERVDAELEELVVEVDVEAAVGAEDQARVVFGGGKEPG